MHLSHYGDLPAGKSWTARLLVLAMWPAAWWLAHGTTAAWSDAANGPLSVDDVVGLAITAAGAAVASYLALSTLPILFARRRGAGHEPRWLRRCTPRVWRKVVGAAVGGAIGVSMATTSFASDLAEPDVGPPAATTSPVTSAGWVTTQDAATAGPEVQVPAPIATNPSLVIPDATVSPDRIAPPETSVQTQSAHSPNKTVTVRRGDSLWMICADLLPPAATESDIAQAWPLLYRANKDVIGENPSLIYAGQTLDVPAELLS